MSTIVERLSADLDAARTLQALVTGDSETVEVAGLVEVLLANLAKAKKCHTMTAAEVVAENVKICAPYAEMGFRYQPPTVPVCAEADAILASQVQLRELLGRAVANLEVKDARRIALLLVKSEKNLWKLLSESRVLMYQSGFNAMNDDLEQQLRDFKATMTTDEQREKWATFVAKQLEEDNA